MNLYIVLETLDYGEYVYLVKAESETKAQQIMLKKLGENCSIGGPTSLDYLSFLLKDNDSICIGGYVE